MILHPPLDKIPIRTVYMIHGYDFQQTISTAKKIKDHFKNTKKYYFFSLSEFIEFYRNKKAELLTKDLFCQASINNINTIVEISFGNAKFSKNETIELNKLLNDLIELKSIIIILIGEKLDKTALSSTWLKLINQIGIVIFIKPVAKYFMQNWVKAQFAKINVEITEEALLKFCDLHHNNLSLAEQNIYKLSMMLNFSSNKESLSYKNFTLTLNDLLKQSHWLEQEHKYTIFDLQRAINSRNNLLILKILDNLKEQSQENLLILWSIVQIIKEKLNGLLGKKDNAKLEQHCMLIELLEKCAEMDLILKGAHTAEYNLSKNNAEYNWHYLLNLCLDTAKIVYPLHI